MSSILDLKTQYLKSLIAPMDGMWEVALIDSAPHWEIQLEGERAGYFAANEEGTLLQFCLLPSYEERGRSLFNRVVALPRLKQATVSTIEPTYLSLCLDVQKKVTVHTYLYESHTAVFPRHPQAGSLDFRLIQAPELDRTISFQQYCLGSDQDSSGWLRGYSANLISRRELYVLCRGNQWVGLGECRKSESQAGISDLGMMVSPDFRGKGFATYVLTRLCAHCKAGGEHAICSTTVGNLGAQKAILRAGFLSRHRILDISL